MTRARLVVPGLMIGLLALCALAACPPAPAGDDDAGAGVDRSTSQACTEAADCPAGLGCRVAEGECAACRVAGECRPGEACVDGSCGACSAAAQCDGQLCVGGTCQACTPGSDDAACATAYQDAEFRCNADGRCGPHTCTATTDCQIAEQICSAQGRCVPCQDAFECTGAGYPTGTLCVDGHCRAAECLEHADCASDKPICGADSRCRTCQTGLECTLALEAQAVCDTASGLCHAGDCTPANSACGSPPDQVCVDFTCAACSGDPQCQAVFGSSYTCRDGHCLDVECQDHGECPTDRPICGADSRCRTCQTGLECTLATQAQAVCDTASGLCHVGDCAPAGSACGAPVPDQLCVNYVCTPCGSDPSCQAVFGAGFLCVGGHCIGAECQSDAECDGGQRICGSDHSCRNCVLGSDECGVDRVCGSDGRCHDGECYPPSTGCCDATGHFLGSEVRCSDLPVATEYRCAGAACGSDAEARRSYRYCTGSSAECGLDNVVWDPFGIHQACTDSQLCQSSPTAAWCDSCAHGCAQGACYPDCNPTEPCCSTTGTRYGCWYDAASQTQWQEPPSTTDMTYGEADTYCKDLVLGGWDDWEMPSISELRTLVRGCSLTVAGGTCRVTDGCYQSNCYNATECNASTPPTCSPLAGPGPLGCYWDSTLPGTSSSCDKKFWSCARNNPEAWTVNFASAALAGWHMYFDARVRCRRGGICP